MNLETLIFKVSYLHLIQNHKVHTISTRCRVLNLVSSYSKNPFVMPFLLLPFQNNSMQKPDGKNQDKFQPSEVFILTQNEFISQCL